MECVRSLLLTESFREELGLCSLISKLFFLKFDMNLSMKKCQTNEMKAGVI